MYLEFYGLKEEPFNLTPDSHFLYLSEQHRRALSHLKYGIEQKRGFILLTGEVGSGKTTVCRALLKMLDKKKNETALILNSFLSPENLLKLINQDLGIVSREKEFSGDSALSDSVFLPDRLNKFLLEQQKNDKTVVVIIDECQNLNFEVLEQIRMLSNLETEKEKLLQIVLLGQPEFLEKISSYDLRQLNQRITVRAHLSPLNLEECSEYIMHRLKVAGSDGSIRFTEKAIKRIYHFCNGIPRKINVICDYALIVGYVEETRTITPSIIKKALKEIQVKRELTFRQRMGEDVHLRRRMRKLSAYAALLTLLIGAGWLFRNTIHVFWKDQYSFFMNQARNAQAKPVLPEEQVLVARVEDVPVGDLEEISSNGSLLLEAGKETGAKREDSLEEPDKKIQTFPGPQADNEGTVWEQESPEEDIEMEIKGTVSIEDIPEGVLSSHPYFTEEKKVSSHPPQLPLKREKKPGGFERLTPEERSLWLLLSAWGIDYNLPLKENISVFPDMHSVINRFNFVALETWEDLNFLIALDLPFAAEMKNHEFIIVSRVKEDVLTVLKSPHQEQVLSQKDFLAQWRGRSIIIMEKGPYAMVPGKTYYRGDSHAEVLKLKAMLKGLGYVVNNEDEFFDIECEETVRNFQKSFLLFADGTVGSETILMLYSRLAREIPRLIRR